MRKEENKEVTPDIIITRGLRWIWMRSREKTTRLKMDKYTCQICGMKKSTAKGKEFNVQVHHKNPWKDVIKEIVDLIREKLLQTPDDLITLCKDCHKKYEKENKNEQRYA